MYRTQGDCYSYVSDVQTMRQWKPPTLEPNSVVELPSPALTLGAAHASMVFIRKEYEYALNEWHNQEAGGGFLLVGSPGIGKSTFGKLLFCLEMSKGSMILSVTQGSGNSHEMLLFQDNNAELIIRVQDLQGLYSDIVVIYDHPAGFQTLFGDFIFKKVLVIHSPSASITNSMKAENVKRRVVMNPLSIDEAEKACSGPSILEKFSVCGGLLRLLKKDLAFIKEDIDEGCRKLTGCFSGDLVGPLPVLVSGEDGKVCHRVLHMHRYDHGGYYLAFGSRYIEETVTTALARTDEMRLLHLANDIDVNGSLRGQIFESRMHHSFGGQFQTLSLDRRVLDGTFSEDRVEINIADCKMFRKLEQIGTVDFQVSYPLIVFFDLFAASCLLTLWSFHIGFAGALFPPVIF